ncbi:asparagine synthase (glutamine-hydrolyzing) [Candidatus Pacearchaeota archaeon]|nr:asparagine synthase (glutamine-hydrolyzing) [Candidatus Pacearchaeota archaeon]
MCGIIAISGDYDKRNVREAINLLSHRGPDDSGIYFDGKIAMAHKRLSIIDLNRRASQPFVSDKGNVIVFNGEIYNFKEIKNDINKIKKYDFKTNSDTEVLLAAYEVFGEKCLNKLNGMFAFVIYDSKKKKFFVARDRLGIKPLYYYEDDKRIIFASEIKAILKFIKARINKDAVHDYFNYFIQQGNWTWFEGIKIFPRANYCIIDSGKMNIKEYWGLEYSSEIKEERHAIEELKKLLEKSIKRRLIADVPVGSFLSGGIDSSLISAIASKNNKEFRTFSVSFDVDQTENKNAKEVSDYLKTKHYSLTITSKDFINVLEKMIWHYDQPISFASSVPLYFLSRLTKDKVKVVLTGEGADELFAGYYRYNRIQKILTWNKKIPPLLKKPLFKMSKNIVDPRYRKNLEMLLSNFNSEYITGINIFIGNERDRLLKVKKNHMGNDEIVRLLSEKNSSFLNKNLWIDLNSYLQELLTKQDRMSMAASIESRVPFLDHKIVEFAAKLSDNLKIKNGSGKYLLKKVAEEFLPKRVIYRKKIGFTVPLDKWFKGELKNYIEDKLSDKELDEFFNRSEINRLLRLNKKKNVSLQLWALLNFKIWKDVYL